MNTTNIAFSGTYDISNSALLTLLHESEYVKIQGIFENAANAISYYASLDPEIIFIDAYQEGFNGFEIARFIKEQDPAIKIVIVSEDFSLAFLSLTSRMGLNGYVSKNMEKRLLSKAIESILAKGSYFAGYE